MSRLTWPELALKLAFVAAERSEDPYVKVGGCALRKDGSVAAVSYNGAPPKVQIDWTNRDDRRKRVVHAETNLLRYIKPNECEIVALTISPCSDCVKQMASYGIKEIYFKEFYDKDTFGVSLAKEFGIKVFQIKEFGMPPLEI